MFKKYLVLTLTILVTGFSATVFAAPHGILFDYFGTGRSDLLHIEAVPISQQSGTIRWNILRNSAHGQLQIRRVDWGFYDEVTQSFDFLVFGDYDGDGRNDIGVWRPGNAQNLQSYFYIQHSTNPDPSAVYGQPWGLFGDFPYNSGDFDADGKDDFAVVREEGGTLSHYILPSSGDNFRRIVFGSQTDFAFLGGNLDFTGDQRDEVAVARLDENNGQITLFAGDSVTSKQVFAEQWGTVNGFEAVSIGAGDYIGDSRVDLVAIYGACGGCANEGTWWIKETGGSGVRVVKFGKPLSQTGGDFPVYDVDYDGDGKADIAVFRQSNSTHYWIRSSDGQIEAQYWDGNLVTPPSVNRANLFENALERRSESIPAAALKGSIVTKQPDGAYKMERASEFYSKNKTQTLSFLR